MPTDLRKLTVPQLKALCKETGVSGYSKLAKASLIEKLTSHGKGAPTGATSTIIDQAVSRPSGVASEGNRQSCKTSQSVSRALQSPAATLVRESLAVPPVASEVFANIWSVSRSDLPRVGKAAAQPLDNPRNIIQISQIQERRQKERGPPSKRQRLNVTEIHCSQDVNNPPRVLFAQATHIAPGTDPMMIRATNNNGQNITYTARDTTTMTSKRYIPLVIKPRDQALVPAAYRYPATNYHEPLQDAAPSEYLDFSLTDETTLEIGTIAFPPSLAQRKYASKLALILRDIDACDMPSLVLSSRLFRYSGYLSASFHLQRWYPGKRLENVLSKGVYVDRMNLWPYRMVREAEMGRRKEAFRKSFLGRLTGGGVRVINESIWKSGDCSKQAVVAVRFMLTMCYFYVTLGRRLEEMQGFEILDVQEVVQGIWYVATGREGEDHSVGYMKCYVLETTCEVIGSPVSLDDSLPTRMDWSVYIQKRVSEDGEATAVMNIMDHVRWTNYEEYERGISKLWLKRTQKEGEFGELKRAVAMRYVLACTMENSLSGRYMTSSEMGQEFRGLPNKTETKFGQERKEPKVNLFVPAHHHVESVHFTGRSGRGLHPALAIVQTPWREYYILKDNGMQVGCEEEGIAEVWMAIIECNEAGEPRSSS